MILAAMLAMALVAASPAMADVVAVSGGFDDDNDGVFDGDGAEFNGVGQNVIGSVGDIDTGNTATANSFATANATASGDSAAAAEANSDADISQDSGVTISQVNAGFGDLDGDGIFDDFEVLDGDLDDDGIFDDFDWIVLVGDFDNDGIVDDFEF